MLSKEDVTDILCHSFDKNSFKEYMEQSEGVIKTLLDFMSLPSEAQINNIDFSPVLKCNFIDKKLDDIDYAKQNERKGIDAWDTGKKELDFDPYCWINNPDYKGDNALILGEYYPSTQKIVLYYNAIIIHVAPLVHSLVRLYKFESDFNNYDRVKACERYLVVAFRIVYAHEYFHAVHHQKGDIDNADSFLIESLARYFELLYCGICPYPVFSDKYARITRDSLNQRPRFYEYKGALTFDKLLGERYPDAVRNLFSRFNPQFGRQCCNNTFNAQQELKKITPEFLKESVAPRYEMFRELFLHSEFQGKDFKDIHTSYCPIPFLGSDLL